MSEKPLIDHIISVLRGLRNGIYYGGKVRLVHAFVMMLLFKKISKGEIKNVFKLGYEHARNLGLFVLSYKSLCIVLNKLWGEKLINSFISGFIFGYLIFGKKTPVIVWSTQVNTQIVLYILSRALLALVHMLYKKFFL